MQLGDTIHLSVGQLVHVNGEPYAIPNPPIPGYPKVKLNKEQLQERHDGILGLPYFVRKRSADPTLRRLRELG
jgi:hypothetical protein